MRVQPPSFDNAFQERLDDLLRWRRDVRHFLPDALAGGEMDHLLRLACLAPSVGNAQPWRFVRVRSPALRARLADHADAERVKAAGRYDAGERRDHYLSLKLHALREAPEILAVFSDEQPQAGHGLGTATMPEMLRYSTVLAIHSLWLAARARGIGLGWVSIVDPATVAAMLEAPRHWSLIACLCLGYPAEPSNRPELEVRGWQERHDWADKVIER